MVSAGEVNAWHEANPSVGPFEPSPRFVGVSEDGVFSVELPLFGTKDYVLELPTPGSSAYQRDRSMGAHPSTMGTAPVPRLVDLPHAYRRFEGTPADAVWPRATVRPTAGLNAGELIWSAKIWVAPGKEARVNGVWVTRASTSQEEVFWWAQKTVKEFREMAVFHRTGALGSHQRRWAPEW